MLEKSEAFVAIVCNRFQRKPLTVWTDNGGGCVGYEMKNYLTEEGMHNQLTVLYTSKQNGVAEKEKSISHWNVQVHAPWSKVTWQVSGEEINTATNLQNRLFANCEISTPFELWSGHNPSPNNLNGLDQRPIPESLKNSRWWWILEDRKELGCKGHGILNSETETIKVCSEVYIDDREQ